MNQWTKAGCALVLLLMTWTVLTTCIKDPFKKCPEDHNIPCPGIKNIKVIVRQ